jgi:hypothetical protein
MINERGSRALEKRSIETEMGRTSKPYKMNYTSPTDIPEHLKRDGFEQYWERLSLRGQHDSALDTALVKGWKPVPIERDPTRMCDILGRNPMSSKYVCQGDVILLERELEIGVEEKEKNNKMALDRVTTHPAYNYRDPKNHTIGTVR